MVWQTIHTSPLSKVTDTRLHNILLPFPEDSNALFWDVQRFMSPVHPELAHYSVSVLRLLVRAPVLRCLLADVSKLLLLRHPCPCDAPSPILVKSLAWTYDASAEIDVQDMSYGVSLEQPPSLPSDALRLDTILEMHTPSLRHLMCMDTAGGASSESRCS